MCLYTKYPIARRKSILNNAPLGDIKAYKVVGVGERAYYSVFVNNGIPYNEGINEADTSKKIEMRRGDYRSGFHFFKSRLTAERRLQEIQKMLKNDREKCMRSAKAQGLIMFEEYKIITCTIKRSWISMMGREGYLQLRDELTVFVSKKAIFPKFRKSNKCKTK